MKKILLFAVVSVLALSSCKKDKEEAKQKEKVFKGAVAQFHEGKAWTTYEIDANDKPLRLSVSIDDAAMASLDGNTGDGGHQHDNSLSLKLHPKATGETPYTHVMLDWNPSGHEPEPIYGKSHFDFHFFIQSEAERLAIPTYDQAKAQFDNLPAAGYMPPTYINPGGGVPQMGAHWLDVTTPELNGAPFTQTFIYGSYDGKVTFMEPMITKQFILDNPAFQRSIPQPTKYQKAGWYPTKMRIEKKDGATSVILEDFVQRQAS